MPLPEVVLRRVRERALRPSRRSHPEARHVRRRRRVAVAAAAVVGTGLLFAALAQEPGSRGFLALTVAVGLTWLAGGLLSGPVHLGSRRLAVPVLLGVAAWGVFSLCALVLTRVPLLARQIAEILAFADSGNVAPVLAVALVTGAAEEVFFRGALYTALGDRHPVLWTTAAYVVLTGLATLNLALFAAAAVMGTLFALQRRATGGILAPLVTHLTWSVLMIFLLPR